MTLAVLGLLSISTAFAQKTQKLFNGKNLDGWKIHGTEKWYVEKGELICESGPDKEYGYLATEKSFKDFELTVQFKQEANGNSGVFFHSSLEGTKISGWQAEVAPPGSNTGRHLRILRPRLADQTPADKDQYLKMGEWNTMKVVVKGDQVTTYLNGHEMITLKDEKIGAKEGQIALQIHSGGGIKVRWKNIKIKEL